MTRPHLSSTRFALFVALGLSACSQNAGMNVLFTDAPDASSLDGAPPDPPSSDGSDGGFRVDPFDDFEDGDLDVNVAGGRFGHWYNYDDATEGTNQIAAITLDPASERHTTASGTSKMALRVQATGYTRWGSGFSADVAASSVYDVSAYTGLVLWTKNLTEKPVIVKVAIPDINSDPRGGRCNMAEDAPAETACYDAFAKNLTLLPGSWQIHLLPFWSLRQVGYGLKVPTGLAVHEVYAVAFAELQGTTYDYLVDDIGFYVE